MPRMTLTSLKVDFKSVEVPSEIVEFLKAVDSLVEQHRINTAVTFRGFVPCDYVDVYRCLKGVYDSTQLCGDRFCEWGSGVSIVASLAAMIGYESYGIEFDPELCQVADGICEEFDVPVELVQGSFIPDGVDDLIEEAFAMQDGQLALHTDPDNAYKELGFDVNDFDLIFAYPWPNDIELTCKIFERCAAQGALLLAYLDTNSISLYRKE